jgi:signal transduction histidine kinase
VPRTPFFFELHRKNFTAIKLNQDDLLHDIDGQVAEYFQIDETRGTSYHSKSLRGRSLPLDPVTFAPGELVHWEFDDTWLDPDIRVRRVMLKASAVRRVTVESAPPPWVDPGRPPGEDPRPRPPRPRGPGRGYAPPAIFVQCACKTEKRDAALQGFAHRRDEELAAVEAETADSLAGLRTRLLATSVFTFAATVVGSFWLVWLGLAPLRRLSEAVSRVSPRDFRLPFADPRLPAELRPIVGRLNDTLGLLKRAFAREKQATADISHELRTPLAALLTTTELALRKPRSAEDYRELLQDCRLSAQQMNQAVERLLTLARLDAGVETLRPQSVDVGVLAEQCAAVVRPLAEARGLSLTVHNRCDPPADSVGLARGGRAVRGEAQVTADPDKLREVLTNLLHNAIQYNRPRGAVDVTLARANGHLRVEVSDTGIGIAPEAREHIFERFYRADPSRGTDGLHAGLGLAIVKEYVDLMGGTIAVESAAGQGSTFRLELPVR